ncbi:hypothetical protein [Hespellia stercorisuis]|nr:hypothetical protein [Hespellia stercorisuis]
MKRLIIDGNAVYEIDEECMLKKRLKEEEQKNTKNTKRGGKEKRERR